MTQDKLDNLRLKKTQALQKRKNLDKYIKRLNYDIAKTINQMEEYDGSTRKPANQNG